MQKFQINILYQHLEIRLVVPFWQNLFLHQCHEKREQLKPHNRLSSRYELNSHWIFSLEKVHRTGDQFLLDEIASLHHLEILNLLTNPSSFFSTYCVAEIKYNLWANGNQTVRFDFVFYELWIFVGCNLNLISWRQF